MQQLFFRIAAINDIGNAAKKYLGKEQLIIGKAAINNQECGNYLPRGIGIAARIKYR